MNESRLINANALKKSHCSRMCGEEPCPIPCEVVGWIDEQPTAYDLDKVVEQLERLKEVSEEKPNYLVTLGIGLAIEIVKKGGAE